jgi:hypothetical protein
VPSEGKRWRAKFEASGRCQRIHQPQRFYPPFVVSAGASLSLVEKPH